MRQEGPELVGDVLCIYAHPGAQLLGPCSKRKRVDMPGCCMSMTFARLICIGALLLCVISPAVFSQDPYPDWCSSETVSQSLGEWNIGKPISVSSGDLDMNGYQDLVLTSLTLYEEGGWESRVSVVFRDSSQETNLIELGRISGNGDVYDYPFGLLGYVCSPAVVDLDGDGYLDVVAICQTESADLAKIVSTADIWWGEGTSRFTRSSEPFVAGSLAKSQMCVLDTVADGRSSLLFPSISTGQILELEVSPTRNLCISSFLKDVLPIAPASMMACSLSEDGLDDIVVAGFVPDGDSTIRRALVILYSETSYVSDDELPLLFSFEEAALSPISMGCIDIDNDGRTEILITRRLDRTLEERSLPWASHEEIVLIESTGDGSWRLNPRILWELPGSDARIVGTMRAANGGVQIVLALPDLRLEILDARDEFITSACYLPQGRLQSACLVNEGQTWKIVSISAQTPRITHLYMTSNE